MVDCFRVYRPGEHPKPKKHFFHERFESRRKARNFCINRRFAEDGMVIVHPDGTEEPFVYHEAWEKY